MPDFTHYPPKHEVRARRRAKEFRPDGRMEFLLSLRDQRPQEFADQPASVHIAVGLYENDKTNYLNTGSAA